MIRLTIVNGVGPMSENEPPQTQGKADASVKLLERLIKSQNTKIFFPTAVFCALGVMFAAYMAYGYEEDWKFLPALFKLNIPEILQLRFDSIEQDVYKLFWHMATVLVPSLLGGGATAAAITAVYIQIKETHLLSSFFNYVRNQFFISQPVDLEAIKIDPTAIKEELDKQQKQFSELREEQARELASQTRELTSLRASAATLPKNVAEQLMERVALLAPGDANILRDALSTGLIAQIAHLTQRCAALEREKNVIQDDKRLEVEKLEVRIKDLEAEIQERDIKIQKQYSALLSGKSIIAKFSSHVDDAKTTYAEIIREADAETPPAATP